MYGVCTSAKLTKWHVTEEHRPKEDIVYPKSSNMSITRLQGLYFLCISGESSRQLEYARHDKIDHKNITEEHRPKEDIVYP